jgi:hypothetical protein
VVIDQASIGMERRGIQRFGAKRLWLGRIKKSVPGLSFGHPVRTFDKSQGLSENTFSPS